MLSQIHENRKTMRMQCLPLAAILKAIGQTEVDLLSLDIEGAEYEVLEATLKDKDFKFKVATVEVSSMINTFGRTITELKYLMKRHNYSLEDQVGVDILIRNNKFKPL